MQQRAAAPSDPTAGASVAPQAPGRRGSPGSSVPSGEASYARGWRANAHTLAPPGGGGGRPLG
eukprot:14617429-Alexandrium_andersonii.AAC.1